ncbi:hypothetical protein ACFSCZ_06115 [Siminovitchia sediminis]|uniref:Uncharacterized protein n=1 Tax=Siminovitchia sediminis TaxID=1274353 RepID=A0ABW4KHU3_9BACI
MNKMKEWANRNSWWLPWVGVAATIFGLIFPHEFFKIGQSLKEFLQLLLEYWIYVIIVIWVIYVHLEIRWLKKRKKARESNSEDKVC